jgi:hypothetical protein
MGLFNPPLVVKIPDLPRKPRVSVKACIKEPLVWALSCVAVPMLSTLCREKQPALMEAIVLVGSSKERRKVSLVYYLLQLRAYSEALRV